MTEEPLLFALGTSQPFGAQVAAELGLALAAHEERRFEDRESKLRPLVSVRGRDAYVLHSLHDEPVVGVHDKLCELLFFIATLKDAGAARVTAVLPYLCYARKDRRTKPRDPVTTRYIAQLLEAMGVSVVVALEVHNRQAFDNAFRCRAEHLEARTLLSEAVLDRLGEQPFTVVSPDPGGLKRAELFRQALGERTGQEPNSAFVEKHRSEGKIHTGSMAGEVRGRVALIVDDLISSGATMLRAATACRDHGATTVIGVATHAVFLDAAAALWLSDGLDHLFITNSVLSAPPASGRGKVHLVATEQLFARAISALHNYSESPILET